MRRLPSFSALRAFEAAARLGSFSLACRELHLTPSAISHQVRSLEDYFGRPLCIRRNRCNELTLEGRRPLVDLSPDFDAIACEDLATGKLVLLGEGRLCPILCDFHFLTYRVGQKNRALIAQFRSWLFAKLAGETMSSLNRSP